MRFRDCSDCGRPIRGNYTRCYRCHRRRQRSFWHDPENLEGLEARDAELGRNQFYVYVLDTDYGHYVGHTANVQARLGAHVSDEVESTAGSEPELLWTSYPFRTRREAASFEAALKSLRDQGSTRFTEITGFDPIPFEPVRSYSTPSYPRRDGGCGLWSVAVISVIVAILVLVLTLL